MRRNKLLKGLVVLMVVIGLTIVLLHQRAIEKTVQIKPSRMVAGRQYQRDAENFWRMKSELSALERKEQSLLAVKEESALQEQLAEKRRRVAKLEEEVASLQTKITDISSKTEENKSVPTDSSAVLEQMITKKEDKIEEKNAANRIQQRLLHLQNVCKSLLNNTFDKCEEHAVKGNLYNVSHDIVYCSVEKAGSTFWRRILQVIGKDGEIKDPLKDVGLGQAYSLPSLKDVELEEIQQMMNKPGKRNVVFVRDPYTRLFSGWLDKFYATNPYWWGLGKTIIKAERINATNQSLECGHDVQFNEFVHFFAKDVKEKKCAVDGHFSPSHRHCLPCGLPYSFIGKYETLKEDTMYFLEKANLTHLVKFSDFETSSDEDAIQDSSKWAFQNREKVEKCMPFVIGLRRVWKRLQSRGILNMKAVFPEKELSSVNITEPDFRKILLQAYQSYNIEDNKMNREIALKEAYSTVPNNALYELHEAFSLDFKLFDYDKFPSFIKSSG